jgi:hypothetical protein
MAKKSGRAKKNNESGKAKKKSAAVPVTSYITPLHILALFCALSVLIPWMLEAFGVQLPRHIEQASTWIGGLGLFVFLAVALKGYLDHRHKEE